MCETSWCSMTNNPRFARSGLRCGPPWGRGSYKPEISVSILPKQDAGLHAAIAAATSGLREATARDAAAAALEVTIQEWR